jgi:hypothetical protein
MQIRRYASREKKVLTQMGNQGHCGEYLWAGAVGNVTETHTILGRNFGGTGGRPASPSPRQAAPRDLPKTLASKNWRRKRPSKHPREKSKPFICHLCAKFLTAF